MGRVLAVANGRGVDKAIITVNGKEMAKTSSDGTYSLRNIQQGSYTVNVIAGN